MNRQIRLEALPIYLAANTFVLIITKPQSCGKKAIAALMKSIEVWLRCIGKRISSIRHLIFVQHWFVVKIAISLDPAHGGLSRLEVTDLEHPKDMECKAGIKALLPGGGKFDVDKFWRFCRGMSRILWP